MNGLDEEMSSNGAGVISICLLEILTHEIYPFLFFSFRTVISSSQDTVDTISAWLISEGIDAERIKLSYSKTWIEFPITVEEAERLRECPFRCCRVELSSFIT